MRPPQVGVRRGPGASISESAWSPIERARPVTAEGSSMSPLPCVPAGRFRRSGTRDLLRPPSACSAGSGPWAILGVDPMPDEVHLEARRPRAPLPLPPALQMRPSDHSDRCHVPTCSGRGTGWRIRLALPTEVSAVQPHPVHDHGQPPCHGDLGAHLAPALEHLESPALQPAPAADPGQQRVRDLAQQGPHGFVAAFGDVTGVVGLARGILARRQPEVGADLG